MAELTKQEKKVLEGKLKKATKELVKAGFSKKDVKKFDQKFEEIDEEKKNELLSAVGNDFVELMKNIVSPTLEENDEATVEETSVEEAQTKEVSVEETSTEDAQTEETPVEETPVEDAQTEEASVEETSSEEEASIEEKTEEQLEEEAKETEEKIEEQESELVKTEDEKNEEFKKAAEDIVGEEFLSNKEPEVDPDYEGPEEELSPEQEEKIGKEIEEQAEKEGRKPSKKASSKKTKKEEKKSSDDEEDEEEDDEVDTEEEAKVEGYNKKVLLKLKTSCDRTQKYYSDLRNELRCYKALKFKSNNTGDTYSFKNKVVFKVTIFPKALKIYFALKPEDYQVSKYHHKDAKDVKKYESIPLLLRVSSDRSYKYALELLEELAKKLKKTKSNVKKVDFMPDFETTSKALLIENGGEEILRASCTKDHSTCISDGLAKKCMMLRCRGPIEGEKNVCEISIGELSAAFKTSYVITLDLLKKVGLADKNANYLKVTAMNNCYKAITIFADEYEPEVIRMVVSTGGNITKLVK